VHIDFTLTHQTLNSPKMGRKKKGFYPKNMDYKARNEWARPGDVVKNTSSREKQKGEFLRYELSEWESLNFYSSSGRKKEKLLFRAPARKDFLLKEAPTIRDLLTKK